MVFLSWIQPWYPSDLPLSLAKTWPKLRHFRDMPSTTFIYCLKPYGNRSLKRTAPFLLKSLLHLNSSTPLTIIVKRYTNHYVYWVKIKGIINWQSKDKGIISAWSAILRCQIENINTEDRRKMLLWNKESISSDNLSLVWITKLASTMVRFLLFKEILLWLKNSLRTSSLVIRLFKRSLTTQIG